MRKLRVSHLLLATGCLHQLVGLLGGVGIIDMPGAEQRAPLAEIVRAGVLDAVEPDLARASLIWFVLFGFVVLMLGDMSRRWELRGVPLPVALGYQLLALSLLGVVLFPMSGFWLCIPQALWIIWRSRREPAPSSGHVLTQE
ncbi:MAG TPA: DUF6463 family protein [Polyangiales bacterium]